MLAQIEIGNLPGEVGGDCFQSETCSWRVWERCAAITPIVT